MPAAGKLGIDPIHFALGVVYKLPLGMTTPAVGGRPFVTSIDSKVPLAALPRRPEWTT